MHTRFLVVFLGAALAVLASSPPAVAAAPAKSTFGGFLKRNNLRLVVTRPIAGYMAKLVDPTGNDVYQTRVPGSGFVGGLSGHGPTEIGAVNALLRKLQTTPHIHFNASLDQRAEPEVPHFDREFLFNVPAGAIRPAKQR